MMKGSKTRMELTYASYASKKLREVEFHLDYRKYSSASVITMLKPLLTSRKKSDFYSKLKSFKKCLPS